MAIAYKIVKEEEIEHKNEYFELRISEQGVSQQSIFFSTNAENLETVARAIMADKEITASHWQVVPHLKH